MNDFFRCYQPRARLRFSHEGIAAHDEGADVRVSAQGALILELFAHTRQVDCAYREYLRWCVLLGLIREETDCISVVDGDAGNNGGKDTALVIVGARIMTSAWDVHQQTYRLGNLANKSVYLNVGSTEALNQQLIRWGISDLTAESQTRPSVVVRLARLYGLNRPLNEVLGLDEFLLIVESLVSSGHLVAPFGEIDFGDLKRELPFCPNFGFSRGTPVDRFYLGSFINEVRARISGRTLEIGGRLNNRQIYGLTNITSYETMDLSPTNSPTVVADAHDINAIGIGSVNSIILFNVLEHCSRPWIVVGNLHEWLATGGKVFCAVPNAQRLHRDPKDFWRILPDALAELFKRFGYIEIKAYGNLISSIAALSGISAEELNATELARTDERYPVLSCIVAEKC